MHSMPPWAEAALESFVANVVGNGIRPKPVTGSEELQAQILDAALACREMKEAGEVFIRQRPRRRSDGLSVPMQLQMLEGDHLDSAMFRPLPGGRRIQAGIEFDAVGRRQAYHFWREHPGEFNLRQQRKVIVPADRVIHLFRVT